MTLPVVARIKVRIIKHNTVRAEQLITTLEMTGNTNNIRNTRQTKEEDIT